jgi:DNA-binding CsgD family transcriptional regulator
VANSISSIVLLRDPVGDWNFADFKVVYANITARAMMPREVDNSLMVGGAARMNAVTSHWKTIQRRVEAGETSFIGPFPYTTENADGITVHLEFNVMYVGVVQGQRVFWVTTLDKTAEEYRRRMEIAGHAPVKTPLERLSDRERSVAELIIRGLSTKQIAAELGVSDRTVDNHRANIRRKLNLTDRSVSIYNYLSNPSNT